MATQHGTVRLDGKTGGLIFYKTKYGNLVRSRWTLSEERRAADKLPQSRMGTCSEFGYSSRVGKLMREAIGRCCRFAAQGDTHYRLTPTILRAVKQDKTGTPGFRRLTGDNVSMLEGFRWRVDAGLRDVLLKDCVVQLDPAGGKVSLNVDGLVPIRDVVLQERATHLQLTLAVARIDYDRDKELEAFERSGMIKASSGSTISVGLSVDVPAGNGNLILVGVGYQVMQEVNGQMAGLTEGSGFEIVEMRAV